ncbi:hypothetical protein K0M31_015980 [Melipona bicolor]|uniref:Uncharacterized protein n=1 Tax=Melipona bicolor TaxID=60889 RepID=A0AA40G6I2_9HYME|nr:hypothetical protein K0M31_015980 [Melipona bicolor]
MKNGARMKAVPTGINLGKETGGNIQTRLTPQRQSNASSRSLRTVEEIRRLEKKTSSLCYYYYPAIAITIIIRSPDSAISKPRAKESIISKITNIRWISSITQKMTKTTHERPRTRIKTRRRQDFYRSERKPPLKTCDNITVDVRR